MLIAISVAAFAGGAYAIWRFRGLALRGIPELSAEALGLFRVVLGLALLYALLGYMKPVPEAPRDYDWWGSWGVIDDLLASQGALQAIEAVTAAALVLFTIGLLTRLAYAVSAAGFLVLVLVQLEGGSTHDWGLPLMAILAGLVVRWGDGFSADEAIRRLRGRPPRPRAAGTRYGLGIWLPGFMMGVALTAAAYAKLAVSGDFSWALGGAVQYHWVEDASSAPVDFGLWVASHEALAVAASSAGLAIEALFVVHVLFRSPLVRGLFGLVMASLLAGFFLFQGVFWFPWWMLLLIFLPWQQIWDSLSALVPRSVVIADEGCPMCRRTARALHALDAFDRLEFVDASDDPARGRAAPGVSRELALAEMYAVRPETGAVRGGLGAYLLLGRSLPLLWPAVAVAALPGIRQLGDAVYQRVAARRRRDEPCSDESCATEAAGERRLPGSRWARPAAAAGVGPGIAVLAAFVLAGQLYVSRAAVEHEPLISNFPMYAQTFADRDAYDLYRAHHLDEPVFRLADGTNVTAEIEDLDGRQLLVQVADAAVSDSDDKAAVTNLSDPAGVDRLREQLRRRRGTRPDVIDIYALSHAFDWDEGEFAGAQETRVATIVGESVVVPPTDPVDLVDWPGGAARFTVVLGAFDGEREARDLALRALHRGIPQTGVVRALDSAGRMLAFAGIFDTAEEAESSARIYRAIGLASARVRLIES